MNNEPRVVIIGGGFGGLCAARGLVGAPVSVTLIDKRNYHLFRPMLYQVATGLLSADQISRPLRSILSRQANVEVLMDEVSGIDTDKRLFLQGFWSNEKISTNRDLPSIHELDVWCDDDGITVFQSLPHFDSGFRS